MDKIVFKGIKQVTMDTYQSASDKKGYLWFIRETIQKQEGSQSPFEENRFHIYFGDKKYGDFWGGLYESIGALVEAINQQSIAISNKQEIISDLETIRNNAAKGATALQSYTEQYKGTVTGVKINGTTKNPSSGVVDLGYINKQLSTSTSSSMTLSPNIYYRNTSTSLSTLTIKLGSASNSNIINEYFVEFTTRSDGTTVSLPSTIKWANGETPTFEASTTYQISIVNNLGVVTKFK